MADGVTQSPPVVFLISAGSDRTMHLLLNILIKPQCGGAWGAIE
jgi:hypothetical protein